MNHRDVADPGDDSRTQTRPGRRTIEVQSQPFFVEMRDEPQRPVARLIALRQCHALLIISTRDVHREPSRQVTSDAQPCGQLADPRAAETREKLTRA
jgi:hypothetical protein